MVIWKLFGIHRQSKLMARVDKHGHPHHFCYAERIKSDGTRRQIMVIRTLFAIQRQQSVTTCSDKTWSSEAFLLSRDNQVRWHAETKHGHPHPFCYPKTIKCDGTRIQTWSSTPFLLSRDNQVWWHPETNHGHPHPFCYLETIKSNGTQRQSMVIRTFFSIQRQSSLMARRGKTWSFVPSLHSRDNHFWRHAKTWHGHPHPFAYPKTIKFDGTWWQTW